MLAAGRIDHIHGSSLLGARLVINSLMRARRSGRGRGRARET
jgi:hypothetical protein